MLPQSWIGVLCLATVMLMSACTAVESTLVQFDQSVHFVTPAGTDVVVKPGVYRVEPAGDSEIQLLSRPGAAPVVLQAEAVSELRNPPGVSDPTAMVMAFEPDAYDVVLRQPGRPALAAHGSVSGVQSRALLGVNQITKFRQEPGKGADLVGCIAHYQKQTNCGCWAGSCGCTGWKTYYYLQTTNRGGGTASPSKARFTNASNSYIYDIISIEPGQTYKVFSSSTWFLYPGWTEQEMGPRPWTWTVDVENKVAELNEGNNTSGECP